MIKLLFLSAVLFIVAGCSSTKISIFYDKSFEDNAISLSEKFKSLDNITIDVTLKEIDFPHSFEGTTFIYGANTQWEELALIIKSETKHYPMSIPAAQSRHFYNSGHMGLYLVNEFKQKSFYYCTMGDNYYSLEGKLKQGEIQVSLLDDSSGEIINRYTFEKEINGEQRYSNDNNETIIIKYDDGDLRLYHQEKYCRFKQHSI